MNAAETIQAAIKKLEETVAIRGLTCASDDPGTLIDEHANWIGEMMTPRMAYDVVTLHRTIDAQLAILRFGLKRQEAVDWTRRIAGDKQTYAASLELDLARAILGENAS